jgi:hypothetical protein
MRKIIIIAAGALTLAACNQNPDINHGGKIEVKGKDGATATISKQLPDNLPAYAKVYPGATVTSSMAIGDKGGILTYETTAPADMVMAFYKSAATAAKLTDSMDSAKLSAEKAGAHVIVFNEPGTQRNLSASVQAEGGVTKVALTYGAP